jgi:predicted DNA binding CopG/RHH family protein
MYYFAEVEKSNNEITGLFFQENVINTNLKKNVFKPGKDEEENREIGEFLRDELEKMSRMTLNKLEDEFSIDDIKIESDDLERMKRKATFIANRYTPTNFSAITMYNFIMSFNRLADKGFFITNENREEKYLEVINSEDEKLLDDLEIYLEAMEELEIFRMHYMKLKELKKMLGNAKNAEDVNEALDYFEPGLKL